MELTSPEGLRFDLHPLEFLEDGNARQAGLDGVWYDYPAGQFTTGIIGGEVVPCIDKELQLAFHQGYAPREIDLLDIGQLENL
jgi:lincosamide nucleotidyltransferase A/C/D/E